MLYHIFESYVMSVSVSEGHDDMVPMSNDVVYGKSSKLMRCVHCEEISTTKVLNLFKHNHLQWVMQILPPALCKNWLTVVHLCSRCDRRVGCHE